MTVLTGEIRSISVDGSQNVLTKSYLFDEWENIKWEEVCQDKSFHHKTANTILLYASLFPQGIRERRANLAEILQNRFQVNSKVISDRTVSTNSENKREGVLQIPISECRNVLRILYDLRTSAFAVMCNRESTAKVTQWLLSRQMYSLGFMSTDIAHAACDILKKDITLLYILCGSDGCSVNFIYML